MNSAKPQITLSFEGQYDVFRKAILNSLKFKDLINLIGKKCKKNILKLIRLKK